jgi:hypothetical protein
MMEVYANGFAEYHGGYFINRESALGVMTGWHALMGIPNGRGFFPNAKGFSLNSVHGSRIRIFCGFYAKRQEFVRIRLSKSLRVRLKQWRFACTDQRKSSQDKCKR